MKATNMQYTLTSDSKHLAYIELCDNLSKDVRRKNKKKDNMDFYLLAHLKAHKPKFHQTHTFL
jgi:hypothetical protein